MKLKLTLATLLALFTCSLSATEFYVSPTGTSSGTGSITSPWNLQTALNQPAAVKAGDIIWLRGGVYKGYFTSVLTGNAALPIRVVQYPGERAVIDGNGDPHNTFTVNGSYTYYMSFEVGSSYTNRTTQQTGSWPTDIPNGSGIYTAAGTGNKFINLYVHDNSGGIDMWSGAGDVEVNGCILSCNGWNAPDRPHGHGLYVQNLAPAHKTIVNTVVFFNAGDGMQYYGTGSAGLANAIVRDCVFFETGALFGNSGGQDLLVGGMGISSNCVVTGNAVTRKNGGGTSNFYMGYTGGTMGLILKSNMVYSPMLFNIGLDSAISANTFVGTATGINTLNFPANVWKPSAPTTGVWVRVVNNDYDTTRCTITIVNWSNASSVTIAAPATASNGTRLALYNVEDFRNDVVYVTVTNGLITVPMTGHTVALPVGIALPPPITFPGFGVFVTLNLGIPSPPPPPVVIYTNTVELGFQLQEKANMLDTNWLNTKVVPVTQTVIGASSSTQRFYRISQDPVSIKVITH